MSPGVAAAVALVVYMIGLAAAFGWQTIAHWRATGGTGYRGPEQRHGSRTYACSGLAEHDAVDLLNLLTWTTEPLTADLDLIGLPP